jgi:hypothetical protein
MVADWTRGMSQQATYWEPGSVDAFGRRTFTTDPVLVACRWQDQENMIRTPQGNEIVTDSVVYVGQVVAEGGRLALGDFTEDAYGDPADVPGAREIRRVATSPSLDATRQLTKAWL